MITLVVTALLAVGLVYFGFVALVTIGLWVGIAIDAAAQKIKGWSEFVVDGVRTKP